MGMGVSGFACREPDAIAVWFEHTRPSVRSWNPQLERWSEHEPRVRSWLLCGWEHPCINRPDRGAAPEGDQHGSGFTAPHKLCLQLPLHDSAVLLRSDNSKEEPPLRPLEPREFTAAPQPSSISREASRANSFTSAAARLLPGAASLSNGLTTRLPLRLGSQSLSLVTVRRSCGGAAHKLSTKNAMTTHDAPAASSADGTVSCSQ